MVAETQPQRPLSTPPAKLDLSPKVTCFSPNAVLLSSTGPWSLLPPPSPYPHLSLVMEAVPIPEVTATLVSAHGVAVAAMPHALSHLPMSKVMPPDFFAEHNVLSSRMYQVFRWQMPQSNSKQQGVYFTSPSSQCPGPTNLRGPLHTPGAK